MPNAIFMEITGLQAFAAKLAASPAVVELAGAAALYRSANEIFQESQVEVPVEFGTLRSSGHVTTPEHDGTGWVVTIGYGGAAQDYAYIVHERMDVFHAPPTKAKYLEDPVLRARDRFASQYGKAVVVAMGAMK